MFELILSVILLAYLTQILIFRYYSGKEFDTLDDCDLPTISIVVAARNEEKNILACMESLNKLVYDEDKLEIILINDHSTDKTETIIKNFIEDKPKFKAIIPGKIIAKLKGKANAIACGLEHTTGEVILSTDADCIVHPLWAKTTASYYKDDVGIVCGYTNQHNPTAFKAMQSVDFMFLLSVAAGTMNAGKPLSCIGNNMSYRKSAYDEVGGYESLPFSITEDFKLLKAIDELKKYKIIYPRNKNMLVTSEACENIKGLYWQKKRWGVGGLDSDITGFAVMAISFVVHIALFVMPVLYFPVGLTMYPVKWITDYLLIGNTHKKLGLKLKLYQFLAFEVYYQFYVILLPFMVLFSRKIVWKGRNF